MAETEQEKLYREQLEFVRKQEKERLAQMRSEWEKKKKRTSEKPPKKQPEKPPEKPPVKPLKKTWTLYNRRAYNRYVMESESKGRTVIDRDKWLAIHGK